MLHIWVSDLLPCNFSNFMNLRIRNTLGQKFKSILLYTDHFFIVVIAASLNYDVQFIYSCIHYVVHVEQTLDYL